MVDKTFHDLTSIFLSNPHLLSLPSYSISLCELLSLLKCTLFFFYLVPLPMLIPVPERPFFLSVLGELLHILQDLVQIVLLKLFLTITGKGISFLCSPLRSYANFYDDDTYGSLRILYLYVYLLH